MGIHSTLCEDGAAEHVFDGLRASVFEAYQAWRSLPAKHHDDFHAFCDSLPNDVMRVSPYCIVNNAKDPRVLKMIAWDYEFVDIDFSPEMMRVDVINSDKNAMETEDEVSATTSQFVFFKQTPQHARENLNNYIIHVRVRMRRRVFTTDANLDEHIRKSVKDRIDSEKRVGDNGCWLISNFDIGRWPLLTQHLKYRPNYSGYQGVRGGNDIYRIAVPRLTGTRGCVLSPEVRKHYTLEDYCRIMEDPSDPTGYFIVKGQEKTWRLEKVAPFNQITVLLGKKSGAAQRRVKALIWVHTATMDPFDKAPCWVSIATLLGPNGTCWEQQQQQKSNATLKRLMAEHNTGKQKSKKERILEEKNLHILFHASWLRGRLPLPVIFYALGICSDKEVIVLMGGTLTSLQKDRNNHFEKCAVATIAAARLTCGIEFTTNNSRMQHLAQRRIVKSTNFEHDYVKKHVKEDTVQFMFENYVLRTRLLAHIAPHAGPMPQPTVNSQIRQHRFLRQEQLEINPTFMTSIYGSNSVRLKLLTLSSMCTRAMLCVCGHIEPDDRDSDEHKRVRGLNLYMRHQFTIGLRHALKLAVGQQLRIYKKRKWNLNDSTLLDFPDSGFKFTVVTDKLVYMLSTGNCKMGAKFRNGCTQRTDRSTRLATLAQLRNLHAGGNGEEHSRDTKRRALRTNHWGVECALETPEGLSCGLTTSLACTAFISLRLSAQDEMQIYDFITKSPLIFHICNAATTTTDPLLTNMEMDSYLNVAVTGDNDVTDMDVELFGMVKETTPSNRPNGVMPRFQVHINAICVGFCHVTDIAGICESIDDFRRQKMTFCGVSVSYNLDNYTVSILTDNDRFMRPIFVVTGGEENRIPVERNVALIMSGGNVADQRMLSWPYFWHTGTVDLIGVDKEQNAMIATTPKDLYATRPCGYPTPLCPPLAAARIAAVSCANMVALAATGIAAAVALVALTMAQAVVERSPKKLLCRETNKIKRYTNAEIDPTVILGVNGGDVWFVSHAPSPRESYQIGHAKQASDVALFNNRFATSRGRTLELFYPQQPLVMTHGMAMTKSNQNPNGQNLVVAFICDPYAQEDAIVFNQHSIDRGLLRKLLTECFTETETRGKVGQQIGQVRICNPNMKSLGKVITTSEQTRNDMRKMNVCPWRADGLPAIGEIIAPGDTLFCTVVRRFNPQTNEAVWIYRPVRFKKRFPMRVNRIKVRDMDQRGAQDLPLRQVSIFLSLVVKPTIGNKFAATPGQKGVCSSLVSSEDMPWSAQGTPDLIIGPHAFPSRMTIGTIMEVLVATTAAATGMRFNGTPFRDGKDIDYLLRMAELANLPKFNEVRMFSPTTGLPLKSKVYMGCCYIRSLKHLVQDKINSRSRGALQMLSRQPTAGRANDGGQRFGEMERDCIISHGAMQFMKDRLFYNSDPYRLHVCDNCGLMAVANLKKKSFECKGCKTKSEISQIHIPYAAKLLFQEMMCMNIAPRLLMGKHCK